MKIAVVHDWLTTYAGAERVLEQILLCYPEADIFTLVDFVPEKERAFLGGRTPRTSFIQKLPGARKHYRNYLPLMPLAIEQFDLSGYDLVISNNFAVAKGVIVGPDQLHLSYVQSPIRYAWDLQFQYLAESNLERGPKSWLARYLLHRLRIWDHRSAAGVDQFFGNSLYITRRIEKTYRRNAEVLYPPVDTEAFALREDKEDFYLTASRMVPYKKIPMIVRAFRHMPDRKLVVIGTGPEFEKCRAEAGPNVELMGWQSFDVLRDRMQRARGFIFAAEEDFGIVPIEAQACGTPVIAFNGGGARETVRGLGTDAPTGCFFDHQTPESLVEAIERFEAHAAEFTPQACRQNALAFSSERFRDEFTNYVEHHWRQWTAQLALPHSRSMPSAAARTEPGSGLAAPDARDAISPRS